MHPTLSDTAQPPHTRRSFSVPSGDRDEKGRQEEVDVQYGDFDDAASNISGASEEPPADTAISPSGDKDKNG